MGRDRRIPVRVQLLDGTTAMRSVPDLERATICRAFNEPHRMFDESVRFELAKSSRDVQSSSKARQIDGVIFRGSEPIGKIAVAYEGEERHFRDYDPTNRSDFFKLG